MTEDNLRKKFIENMEPPTYPVYSWDYPDEVVTIEYPKLTSDGKVVTCIERRCFYWAHHEHKTRLRANACTLHQYFVQLMLRYQCCVWAVVIFVAVSLIVWALIFGE